VFEAESTIVKGRNLVHQRGCDSVGSRTIGALTVAALLAIAGLAAAQQPSFSVELEPQDEAGELSPGESKDVTVLVRLTGDNFSCAENEELPVNVSVSNPNGVTGLADPSELVFSDTQGIHNSGTAAGGYNNSQETTVTVQAANTASGGDREVTVTGTFPGGNYGPPEGSCNGEFPSAEGTTSLPVTVASSDAGTTDGGATDGDETTGGNDGGNGTTDGGEDSGGDDNGIPFGPWVAPLALVAGAVALRRR
jgi:hypothetical protein